MTTTATPTMLGPSTSFDRERVPLDDTAQALIDARLETIERMLFGQTPRADRLAIVREVESQIHELLTQRDPNDTDRDAVIAALARLDPPEAYLPDEVGEVPRTVRSLDRSSASRTVAPSRPQNSPASSWVGKTGGILGIIAAILIPVALGALLIEASGSRTDIFIYVFVAICPLVDLLSILAITLSSVDRLRSPWSLVGLTSGIITLLLGLAGSAWSLLLLFS